MKGLDLRKENNEEYIEYMEKLEMSIPGVYVKRTRLRLFLPRRILIFLEKRSPQRRRPALTRSQGPQRKGLVNSAGF